MENKKSFALISSFPLLLLIGGLLAAEKQDGLAGLPNVIMALYGGTILSFILAIGGVLYILKRRRSNLAIGYYVFFTFLAAGPIVWLALSLVLARFY